MVEFRLGFHECEFCTDDSAGTNRFPNKSSGDVHLTFANDHEWAMPDMILHYVADHGWGPPQDFVNDVMNVELATSARLLTMGVSPGLTPVGYLAGSFEQGTVPDGFIEKLKQLMEAAGMGN